MIQAEFDKYRAKKQGKITERWRQHVKDQDEFQASLYHHDHEQGCIIFGGKTSLDEVAQGVHPLEILCNIQDRGVQQAEKHVKYEIWAQTVDEELQSLAETLDLKYDSLDLHPSLE